MGRMSKKLIRAIQHTSVFDSVLRDSFEVTSTSRGKTDIRYFADHTPDTWSPEEREAFDLASEVEHRLKEEILTLLGANGT